jgi:hypothetical protein
MEARILQQDAGQQGGPGTGQTRDEVETAIGFSWSIDSHGHTGLQQEQR